MIHRDEAFKIASSVKKPISNIDGVFLGIHASAIQGGKMQTQCGDDFDTTELEIKLKEYGYDYKITRTPRASGKIDLGITINWSEKNYYNLKKD